MAVEVDLVPIVPGEGLGETLARAAGDICVLTNRHDGTETYAWDDHTDLDQADFDIETLLGTSQPPHVFDEWRKEAIARLASMGIWHRENEDEWPVFWSPGVGWQLNFRADRVVLLWRRMQAVDSSEPGCTDTELLDVFRSLPLTTLIMWTGDGFDWGHLDEPEHPITSIG